MKLNGSTKKVAGWSAATIISVSLGAIALWQKGGAFIEPAVTPAIRAEVKELRENIGSLATDSRMTEFEGKIAMLARTVDTKAGKEEMHAMELRILDKIDESRQETVRLLVQALGREGRTP
jgi:hypothetical protein